MIKSQCDDSKLHLFSACMKQSPSTQLFGCFGPFCRCCSIWQNLFHLYIEKNINKTVLINSKSKNNLIHLKQFTLYTIMHVLNFKSYILIISVFAFSLIFNYYFFLLLYFSYDFFFHLYCEWFTKEFSFSKFARFWLILF